MYTNKRPMKKIEHEANLNQGRYTELYTYV